MRPRIWYSCARPKRSAWLTIIVLARGMSRPDSMMVVRAQHVEAPVDEVHHHLLQLALAHLPVRHGHLGLGHQLRDLLRPLGQVLHPVVHEEHLPAARQLLADGLAQQLGSQRHTKVRMASRSAGGVAMMEISRRPLMAICSVRGMGVAVSVSTSTCERSSFSRSLWVTPKRCSSSITSSPRSLKRTSLRQQPVRADDHVELALGQRRHRLLLLLLAAEAGQRRRPAPGSRASAR